MDAAVYREHMQALASAGFWHTWKTGHREFWFHRRSLDDHELMCQHPDHGKDWLDLDDGCTLKRRVGV